ncbi:MAG TPA: metallophosphoesterase family protein [Anaerolineales bacterium]|nr:metallophosphoesterase family protein [Anaerolineales bacterium]HMV97388.1 metallophosphoesterase family protein [Anaerolineales bacterium]HMX19279.1 metallophosphoesterase family protein [Anaerolineales bacterium]HMX75812.1 metallophosphoesterase family protein [Anaerolineales bacterium]HMZ43945.1 metallophosphoesterase family protein [Anaerolineales bacterium]
MRVLVISDIHANYTALESVLKDAGQVDETWCLGDLVGYGPDPNAVVEEIRDIPNLTCLLGNHDVAAIGKMPLETFNGDARRSLMYHEKVLSASNLDYMRSLSSHTRVCGDATLAHGSPRDPLWEYILNSFSAQLNFDHFNTTSCFVGHSHIQCSFVMDENSRRVVLGQTKPDTTIQLRPKIILNPGSVGQPRDRDPRAAYAIYDTEAQTWTPRRVSYNIPEVQERIRSAGLPEKHALRIADGW